MNVLKLQILQIFDEGYLVPLWHRTLGYSNVALIKMKTYLKDTYSKVENKDSIALKMQLNEQYDTTTTLNDYFNKIEDRQEMSANGTIPISDTELLATAYVNIKSTGIYDNDMENGMIEPSITKIRQILSVIF